ncbi:MAG: tRNA pseudouridine(55) synthase TruB [Hyphomicrobiaceae bacterium]|nr:tRNA pseudouridine(55) synthase TruB [Hyphomicrobiaceae bacterium]
MARRKKGRRVHGWLILDKPREMTSTQAVGAVKRLFDAQKAGHAGTLDPLATGVLPIALGEATKTVSYAVDGTKAYRFTVRWGAETTTDDTEGEISAQSDKRPTKAEIEACLDSFRGPIMQVPPQFSAIKVEGHRAYDLARDGETLDLEAREVIIDELEIVDMPDADTTEFAAVCGKGTYVRSLARDMGRKLGCHGHVIALRRTQVGPFHEDEAVSIDVLRELAETGASDTALRPVEDALDDLEHIPLSGTDAARIARGQAVIMRGRDAPKVVGTAYVTAKGRLLALVEMERGEVRPVRVFNLEGDSA